MSDTPQRAPGLHTGLYKVSDDFDAPLELRSERRSMRQVLLYPGVDGFWIAEVPSLPGCTSQGQTKIEAIENIKDAIDLMVEALQERGEPIPEDHLDAVLVAV